MPDTEELQLIQRISQILGNIIEGKIAEKALTQSEDKFSKALDLTPDAIGITRVNDGKILAVNQAMIDISGYSRDELLGKTTLDLDAYKNMGIDKK